MPPSFQTWLGVVYPVRDRVLDYLTYDLGVSPGGCR